MAEDEEEEKKNTPSDAEHCVLFCAMVRHPPVPPSPLLSGQAGSNNIYPSASAGALRPLVRELTDGSEGLQAHWRNHLSSFSGENDARIFPNFLLSDKSVT